MQRVGNRGDDDGAFSTWPRDFIWVSFFFFFRYHPSRLDFPFSRPISISVRFGSVRFFLFLVVSRFEIRKDGEWMERMGRGDCAVV